MVQTLRISPNKVEYALFTICKCNNEALVAQSLDHTPLIRIGVLELINNDDRVSGCEPCSDLLTPFEYLRDSRREKIEADQPLILCELVSEFDLSGALQCKVCCI